MHVSDFYSLRGLAHAGLGNPEGLHDLDLSLRILQDIKLKTPSQPRLSALKLTGMEVRISLLLQLNDQETLLACEDTIKYAHSVGKHEIAERVEHRLIHEIRPELKQRADTKTVKSKLIRQPSDIVLPPPRPWPRTNEFLNSLIDKEAAISAAKSSKK